MTLTAIRPVAGFGNGRDHTRRSVGTELEVTRGYLIRGVENRILEVLGTHGSRRLRDCRLQPHLRSVPEVTPEEMRQRVCGVTTHGDMDYMAFAGKLANHPIPVHAGTYAREDGRPCE